MFSHWWSRSALALASPSISGRNMPRPNSCHRRGAAWLIPRPCRSAITGRPMEAPIRGAAIHHSHRSNASNASKLTRAWDFHTGELPDARSKNAYGTENTPLKVGDMLQVCTPKNMVIAVDAATGQQKWKFDPKVPDASIPYTADCRGVTYYEVPNAVPNELCASRTHIHGTHRRAARVSAEIRCDGVASVAVRIVLACASVKAFSSSALPSLTPRILIPANGFTSSCFFRS